MDGILIIDKPKGFTSHDIVNIARKALKTRRIGHIGTLDPNATGVLVLCIDRATKLVKYLENHSKTYEAEFCLGIRTDTDDITGKILEIKDATSLDDMRVFSSINSFLGKQKQFPPAYSAVKLNGRKLYELARKNIPLPDLDARDIEVHEIKNFKVIEKGKKYRFEVTLKVSKGTYIRSIARDLGELLDIGGTLTELRRTAIEDFLIEDTCSLEELKEGNFQIREPFAFLGLSEFVADEEIARLVDNGRYLEPDLFPSKTDTIIRNKAGEPLAIYYYDEPRNQMRMSVKWC